jgi:hypothetical protein
MHYVWSDSFNYQPVYRDGGNKWNSRTEQLNALKWHYMRKWPQILCLVVYPKHIVLSWSTCSFYTTASCSKHNSMERCISLKVEKPLLRYMNIYRTQKYSRVELILSKLLSFHIPTTYYHIIISYFHVLVTRHRDSSDYWMYWKLIVHDYK